MRIQHYRGDSASYSVQCKRGAALVDITGATLFFTVKAQVTDTDPNAAIRKDSNNNGIVITQPTRGKASIILVPVDTATLAVGIYTYDVQIKTLVGDVYTIVEGVFEILADITRRIV